MAIVGRSIRLFLADGSPTGILTAEIMNWTGHIVSAPRSKIVEIYERPEVRRTGIYLLIGSDPANLGQTMIYIGESDDVGDRLFNHNKDSVKDFWESTCVVTNKDANLTKTHVKYLESRLIALAKAAGRVQIQNGTAPIYDSLPESDRSDMEYFIEQLQTLFPVLGYDFIRQSPQITSRIDEQEVVETELQAERNAPIIYEYNHVRPTTLGHKSPEFAFSDGTGTINARAIEANGEMIVLKGSTARTQEAPSLASNVRLLRAQLRSSSKLLPTDENGILRFEEDVAFTSPSAASQAVMATSRNGRTDWRVVGTGQTYADWQQEQLSKVHRSLSDQ
jgi:hypothetical protein